MNAETINGILGIQESYKMPDRLMNILMSEDKDAYFDRFMEVGEDLKHDWFNEYYQNEHGDRDKLKQDFTPDSVCEIAMEIIELKEPILDMCSGTGALTIRAWNKGHNDFYCIEYAERAIPVLIFNLAIRNIKATVFHADAITREVFNVYILNPGEKYSEIIKSEDKSLIRFTCGSCIMNPPYSLKWDGARLFGEYPTPPKSKADYCFMLDALERLESDGEITAILSHGVLFRGATEGKIRAKLIENRLIDCVIGLPDKLFLNTRIPVCIIKLKKNRDESNIFFLDASKEFRKDRAYNILDPEHIEKIVKTYKERNFVDKYADIATLEKLKDNEFNLNIPRYVDTFEDNPPEHSIDELAAEMYKINQDIRELDTEILKSSQELTASAELHEKKLSEFIKCLKEMIEENEKHKLELENP